MKKYLLHIPLLITLFTAACSFGPPDRDYESAIFSLSFTPEKSEKAVVDLISDARESIYVALYGFDNEPIEEALAEAYLRRGIDVQMVTEYDSETEGSWQRMIQEGIPVHLRNTNGIMHHKFFVVDRKYVVTGSTNLTEGMLKHFNNMMIINSPELAENFIREFRVLQAGTISGSSKDKDFSRLYMGPSDIYNHDPYDGDPYPVIDGPGSFYDASMGCTQVDVSGKNYIQCPEQEYSIGQFFVKPYFTPYRYAYPSYKADTGGLEYLYYNYDKALYQTANYNNALNVVIPLIENAQKSVTILSFAFTDRVIIDRLIKAYGRGVDVRVYMDYMMYRSQFMNSGATYIQLAEKIKNFKICRRADGGLLHHKVIMVDDEYLVLGSLNFSSNAVTSNDENFLVIRNAAPLISAFMREKDLINQYSYFVPDTDEFSGYFDENGDPEYGAY
jgi:phosphatidylserine/phosphatidylglycerophosphate/cardiolipin synthase-like enzyme